MVDQRFISKFALSLETQHRSEPPTQPFAVRASAPLKSQNMRCRGKKKVLRRSCPPLWRGKPRAGDGKPSPYEL